MELIDRHVGGWDFGTAILAGITNLSHITGAHTREFPNSSLPMESEIHTYESDEATVRYDVARYLWRHPEWKKLLAEGFNI